MMKKSKKYLPRIDRVDPRWRGFFWGLLIILIGFGGFFGVSAVYASRYDNRIYPGVMIGAVAVGGLTADEALVKLNARLDQLLTEQFIFKIGKEEIKISPRVWAPGDPDLIRELVSFDKNSALEAALRVGRADDHLRNVLRQWGTRYHSVTIPVNVTINRLELLAALRDQLSQFIVPGQNAALAVWEAETDQPVVTVLSEQRGTTFDEDAVLGELEEDLNQLLAPRFSIAILPDPPEITRGEAQNLVPQVKKIFERGPWKLIYGKKEWPLTREILAGMLSLDKKNGRLIITLTGAGFTSFMEMIKQEVNRQPQRARFKLENGRVTEFGPSSDGVELDLEATRIAILALIQSAGKEAPLIIKTASADLKIGDLNSLGIEELLGVGVSNFRGSPRNRIKNIQNGARLLNGLLIKPGEEFSLLAALRPFTAENGFLPELVIKGDKITPEIGGGLCQIGTTTFRATMNSGLPITRRRNHSLVVSYYNDPANRNPGTDATIYDPAPDFRFINDTGTHLLLTTEIDLENFELRFYFWGRGDGRRGYYSAPEVTRWLPVGSTVFIETTDLSPGEKKCQAKHPGADARFTYTIARPDGVKQETVYESHYRPLPEICLIGVAEKIESSSSLPVLTPTEGADLNVDN